MPAPYVDLPAGGYDEWIGQKSRHFRQHLRQDRRDFEQSGGSFHLAESPAELRLALQQFERLHRHRWAARGGSGALSPRVAQMLRCAGERLSPGRLQIWTAQVDGAAVASALFVAAGDETHYWLGGFDEQWSRCSPSRLLLVEAVRFAGERNLRRVSLGPGGQAYKYRLATGEDQLDWVDLLPRGSRYPYVRVQQVPYRLHMLAVNHTPAEAKQRLRPAMASLRRQRADEPRRRHVHDEDGRNADD
jgi:CelD/BcsL family acetyltransferase involved in cellulose biosynthesis